MALDPPTVALALIAIGAVMGVGVGGMIPYRLGGGDGVGAEGSRFRALVVGLVACTTIILGLVTIVAIGLGGSLPTVWGGTVAIAIATSTVAYRQLIASSTAGAV